MKKVLIILTLLLSISKIASFKIKNNIGATLVQIWIETNTTNDCKGKLPAETSLLDFGEVANEKTKTYLTECNGQNLKIRFYSTSKKGDETFKMGNHHIKHNSYVKLTSEDLSKDDKKTIIHAKIGNKTYTLKKED